LELEDSLNKPVFKIKDITHCWVSKNNLYIVALCKGHPNVMMVFYFLHKLIKVLEDYFTDFHEESLKDNFVITYELLDEVMDHGYPQLTETTVLKEFIKSEAFRTATKEEKLTDVMVPTAASNVVSWRPEGIKYKKNEIFLDAIEELNMLCSATGNVLSSEILGSVQCKSMLSGMPELKLGLNDKKAFEIKGKTSRGKLIELEDIKFHQCVRLAQFDRDRTISFVPPDGEFELMTYRLSTRVKPLIWVECTIESHTKSKIEYLVKVKAQFKSKSIANNVEIYVPVPCDVDSPNFKTNTGTVEYLPEEDCMHWSIKQFAGRKEFLMRATFGFPSVEQTDREKFKNAIRVKYEIPYFTVSGIQVRYLKIVEKSGYKGLPWVRYITKNGQYQIRMS
jgi:AP-1 complex subunit mu